MTTEPKADVIRVLLPTANHKEIAVFSLYGRSAELQVFSQQGWRHVKLRDKVGSVGVYVLWGEEGGGTPSDVYVGESEKVWDRIGQHLTNPSMEYWTRAAVFAGRDLHKAHVQFLEASLCTMAREAGRCNLKNIQCPTLPPMDAFASAEAGRLLPDLLILLRFAGAAFFEPITRYPAEPHQDAVPIEGENVPPPRCSYTFLTNVGRANMVEVPDGYLVLKQSVATGHQQPALQPTYVQLRDTLIKNNVLVREDEHYLFQQDYIFRSPSAAACVVSGAPVSALDVWMCADGRSLRKVREDEQTDKSEAGSDAAIHDGELR